MDDGDCEDERETARRWAELLDGEFQMSGGPKGRSFSGAENNYITLSTPLPIAAAQGGMPFMNTVNLAL